MTKATTNLLDVLTEGRTLPEGHVWAIKTVRDDFTTRNGFTWPASGQVEAPGPIIEANTKPCPTGEGDGICVALTWFGMATGGTPAKTLLLCSVHNDDILGQDGHKLRVRRALVHDVIDGWSLLREHGRGANLRGASLRYASLDGANLEGANLGGANLWGANLWGAYLGGADLTYARLTNANLADANLIYANLRGANLRGANLRGAYLEGAYLEGAYLTGADLTGADLTGADLEGADLEGADLEGADLTGADLTGAEHR